ncbi:hypothetical protein SteCoe_701 [Stentor coeruleus]|uniref:Myb-like DNA-binding domain containing protein n=1 Tax=Stentor coeruleus TaxID=5963 RepID=A0A1R2D3G5_9CILI|nr:hypothetical protein SteCoe_701 [Stentor coeruleus]
MSEELSKSSKFPIRLEDGTWLVQCKLDQTSQKFIPLHEPIEIESKSLQRNEWTEEEDKLLEELILFKGSKKWTNIANKLNDVFHNGEAFRLGKHCRERWLNHLDPSLKKSEWTPEEDEVILTNQAKIGNKWSIISKLLPGRTENQVKNRWKSILRKASKWIRNGISGIKVEWGGEVGCGEGSDCGEVYEDMSKKCVQNTCCELENEMQAIYFDYLDSPSYFYT